MFDAKAVAPGASLHIVDGLRVGASLFLHTTTQILP